MFNQTHTHRAAVETADRRIERPLSARLTLLAGSVGAALMLAGGSAQAADAPSCEVDHPVRFGGMNWESNLIMTEIEKQIVEKGYGCETEVMPTETLPALAALERGDLDVNSEIWSNTIADPWKAALATGKVQAAGTVFMGSEGWFIPTYTAERLPELKKATDLPKFKEEFEDPEEPGKGRFYGCPAGWGCEVVVTQLFKASPELSEAFTNYSPGTGAAQKAAITADYKRKRNVVFYYWKPTPMTGAMDLVELEFPKQKDENQRKCLTDPNCGNPELVAYQENPVYTAVNTQFAKNAPKLGEFFKKVNMPAEVIEGALTHLEENGLEPEDVAEWFLKEHADVWKTWVPEDVAARVQADL